MSTTPYTPRQDSLPSRVIAYFRRLPDEELSSSDIAMKWHVDTKNVGMQLKLAVEAGLLKKDGSVYSAGDQIKSIDLTPERPRFPFGGESGQTPAEVDIEGLEFEDIPANTEKLLLNKKDRWVAKLRTVPEGKSTPPIPYAHRHLLRQAVTDLRKEGYVMHCVNVADGCVRVFCTQVGGAS